MISEVVAIPMIDPILRTPIPQALKRLVAPEPKSPGRTSGQVEVNVIHVRVNLNDNFRLAEASQLSFGTIATE